MTNVVSLPNSKSQEKLLRKVNDEITDLENKMEELKLQRNMIELKLYTPRELAKKNISRKSKNIKW